eukprot:EC825436.1.p3 GENE.EC825436.1~~EC825436.1.p3  ORF type:complete len:50 (-),score=0.01 EC825436.1:360-509(-)
MDIIPAEDISFIIQLVCIKTFLLPVVPLDVARRITLSFVSCLKSAVLSI